MLNRALILRISTYLQQADRQKAARRLVRQLGKLGFQRRPREAA